MFLRMDIRRAALIACIASALSSLMPIRNMVQTMMEWTYPRWWVIPAAVVVPLLCATMPVFYFALYGNHGSMRFSPRQRLLAITAALAMGPRLAIAITRWIGSLGYEGPRTVLAPNRGMFTRGDINGLFGILADAAVIFLMVRMYRHVTPVPDAFVPVSTFLRIATLVALILWGIWVASIVCRLVLSPYIYAMIRKVAFQIGRTPPSFRDIFLEMALPLWSGLGILAAPFIIWRASLPPADGSTNIQASVELPPEVLSR